MTTVTDPQIEDPAIRGQAEALLTSMKKPTIETVANTIFPIQMARTSTCPDHLVERYRAAYATIKRFDANHIGTYFGRMVDHPNASTRNSDQLTSLINKLRAELKTSSPMSARYEVAIRSPNDSSRRGFPCMSSCSFQLDGARLHLLALYRYEYLVEKGYGNYLGLARLQGYVADQAGLEMGRLSIVCGRVHADASRVRLAAHLGLGRRRPV